MAANKCPGDGIGKFQYLEHEIAYASVELGPVVVPLPAQAQEILCHARHDVAVYLHVDVTLRRLELAVALDNNNEQFGRKIAQQMRYIGEGPPSRGGAGHSTWRGKKPDRETCGTTLGDVSLSSLLCSCSRRCLNWLLRQRLCLDRSTS